MLILQHSLKHIYESLILLQHILYLKSFFLNLNGMIDLVRTFIQIIQLIDGQHSITVKTSMQFVIDDHITIVGGQHRVAIHQLNLYIINYDVHGQKYSNGLNQTSEYLLIYNFC